VHGIFDLDSWFGPVVVAIGYFGFVSILVAGSALTWLGRLRYKQGLSDLNPCGCMATAFAVLLIVAVVIRGL